MKAIINGRVIVPQADGQFTVRDNYAVFYDEQILAVLPMEKAKGHLPPNVIDAAGGYVSPGFINVHIHGCGGCDTMDEDVSSLVTMQRIQAQTGVTAFLPTTMTYDLPRIYRAFERVKSRIGQAGGAEILGCNMEGPFVSPARKGAQDEQYIIPASFDKIAAYADVIRIVTIAPEELHGDYTFIRDCQNAGIIVSIGHTSADYETVCAAFKAGATHVTHLYNAMTSFNHRKPGVVGAALDNPVNCELICDNIHLHPVAQRLAYHAKNKKHIVLITDSMRACALGDGESELGGQKVFVNGPLATLADGTIAGSVLTMDRAIANFSHNTGSSVAETVSFATKVPAEELGIYNERGSLEPGKRADITIFDSKVEIRATIVNGETVYCQ